MAAASAAALTLSIACNCAAVRSAPGRSDLLTTTISATSSKPALMAWTSSPISGACTTSVVSAMAATSTSLCPVPTVSMKMSLKPQAARTAAASAVVPARPPRCPREAIERMNTSPSAAYCCIRMRSPRMAPPVTGLDGSMASTATARSALRASATSADTSVDLPLPGGPVTPTSCAPMALEKSNRRASSATDDLDSTAVSKRVSARREPDRASWARRIPAPLALGTVAPSTRGVITPCAASRGRACTRRSRRCWCRDRRWPRLRLPGGPGCPPPG